MRRRTLATLLAGALSIMLVMPPAVAAKVIHHGARTAPVVALTFDDGWSPARVREILAILVRNKVPATFFPYANAMRRSPATWRAVAAAGYPVGNHTVSHPRLTTLSATAIRYQICGFRGVADDLLGRPSIAWFRPPYGRWNPLVARIAASCGYQHVVLWDVDSRDWTGESPLAITVRASAGGDGSIVLMHAGPANTPLALQGVIDAYRARGFDFVTIPELLGGTLPAETAGSEPAAITTSGGDRGQDVDWSIWNRRFPIVD
ncbi:MAG: polysaccharide deacetylase family protein [Candidatus Limnocylindrales bacterium]